LAQSTTEEDDWSWLQLELGAAPVATLGVVPYGVAGFHAHPLRQRAVLRLLARQLHLDAERLVRRHV